MTLNIPMRVDRASRLSIRAQIVQQLRSALESGVLGPGSPVPSSRAVASALGVSRSTVVAALQELEGEGWIESSQGSGTVVSHRPHATSDVARDPAGSATMSDEDIEIDMRPGDLNPEDISRVGWRAAWRSIEPSTTPPPPPGSAALRAALCTYLRSSRGLPCDPSQIVVCAGTAEALTLLTLAFQWRERAVAVEDPGYPDIRRTFQTLGVRWVPVDVTDADQFLSGLQSIEKPIEAAYLTPSHQYPLGHRISPGVRGDILRWARDAGVILVEDDYDSEFRFGVAPLPSLAGLDTTASTIYLGTMSKVLDPGLRLSYLRVPTHLLQPVLDTRDALGATVSAPVQQAVTHLLTSGELARHIARVRKLYQDRRATMLQSLEKIAAVTHVTGTEAGLHVLASLRQGISASAAVEQARSHGMHITDLDDYRARLDLSNPGLVLGYGQLKPATIRHAVNRLATLPALQEADGR
ncbi:PLP-dependent aminotransferase family protein [Mycobacteroides abscessus]|uniref:MocR-like pyridoxine biosynthesis transcription factor PdxR n=1 Tax=Mycobacteroides abscessus TaxID=36809 RepID=UPI000AAE9B1B|nr:PLP-dependent aminotransferase family protein [Mycobacteroides abscessus]MDO3102506.1 PLP-dependent aminotransferase family protein [Mycobacteroides abscessus subsp. abscessus]